MAEHFVLDHGGVVVDPDVLDGDGRDLGDHDAAESVGDGGVDADQAEGGIVLAIVVELDAQLVAEYLGVPRVVFAGVMTRKISRSDVCDGFFIDANDLCLRRCGARG